LLTPISDNPAGIIKGRKTIKVALIGNPNSGKSTLFNALTGLNQKIGNFPGVTVDKRIGRCKLENVSADTHSILAEIIDLPGTYSLFPKSIDEEITFEVLCNPNNEYYPDVAIVVADASNLKRSLFLCSQVIDLKIPVVLALNMIDLAESANIKINTANLAEKLGVAVIPLNARKKQGIEALKKALFAAKEPSGETFNSKKIENKVFEEIKNIVKVKSNFGAFVIANNATTPFYFSFAEEKRKAVKKILEANAFDGKKLQTTESLDRHKAISGILKDSIEESKPNLKSSISKKLDNILTHKFWGYLIFLFILFIIFQAIFSWSAYPMQLIEKIFSYASEWTAETFPKGVLNDLLVNGIIAGLSGIVVFVPQIALLFAFISILEDTGYMARVSFIMDKLMRKFGLNGRSVIPLISGIACAVPAIMSARTISNWKERMITIMVTPLMSCSARLPVYALIISLIIPAHKKLGIFNMQGITLMALYLIGFLAAIVAAWLMKFILKAREKSYFIMEMPVYRMPRWSNIGLTILEKVKLFLFDAGKVIIAISIILWALSSYGPTGRFKAIEEKYNSPEIITKFPSGEIKNKIKSEKLEASYAGIMGKKIEPLIAPLGFDWKIGISLLTSFAAREVFVGTMATIYSAGDAENTKSIREKMMAEINPHTGKKMYTPAVGFSLLLFYAFAMQCMSTLAIVYRETKHWKWPLIQFLYMGILAYLASFTVYQLLK